MSVINTSNLTKYYNKTLGIKEVTLEVNAGEVFGFIGPNGAGKSTAIRTLLSLIFPTSGSATIFGHDIVKEGKKLKQRIGYLPSDVSYYKNMTARELLEYSLKFYGKSMGSDYLKLCDRFQLDDNKKFAELSMGNKKKVAIIQSVIHNPELLILDEPTNGLDPLMQNEFFDLMRDENKKGVTIFFSSHVLSDIQRMCDRVAVIRSGEIIAIESIDALLQKQLKKCRLVFEKPPAESSFSIEGINDLSVTRHRVEFTYSGDTTKLLDFLSAVKPVDVLIEEPSLEQIFMHYYE